MRILFYLHSQATGASQGIWQAGIGGKIGAGRESSDRSTFENTHVPIINNKLTQRKKYTFFILALCFSHCAGTHAGRGIYPDKSKIQENQPI